MTQQKYIVTDDQLQNLVDSMFNRYGQPRLSRFDTNKLIDQLKCREIPYVEPADDWRKKWKDKTKDNEEVLFVSPEWKGAIFYVCLDHNGKIGFGQEEVNWPSDLMPIMPAVRMLEAWFVIKKDGKRIRTIFPAEPSNDEFPRDKFDVVRLEGSYET